MSGLAQVFRRSWFARVVTTFAAMFTALVGLVLIGVWLAATNLIAESARQELDADLASFGEVYAQRLLPGLREAVERRALDIGDRRVVLLIGRQGETLAGNRDRIPADLLHADATPRRFGAYRGVSKPLLGGFTLALAHERTRDDILLRRLAMALGGLSLIAVVFSLAGGYVIGQTALARVASLNATLTKVAEGDLSARAPGAGGADEFSTLSARLNATLERMGVLVAALKAIAERIAHEMRSPLAHLRADLEDARKSAPAPLAGKMSDLVADVDEIIAVFSALLDVTLTEAAAGDPHGLKSVDIDAVVDEAVELYDAVAEERGVRLMFAPRGDAQMLGDRHLLLRMIANLIDNAVKFSPAGGDVRVGVERVGADLVIEIADQGPGLPAGFETRAFEPFARAQETAATPGHGLGLTLVQAIATRHGMKIRLHNSAPGLRVEIRGRALEALPTAPAA